MVEPIRTRITNLLGINYPIIQGGMGWIAESKLAAAVSHAGGLGLLGTAYMSPRQLGEEINNVRQLTDKPFGVNIALIHKNHEKLLEVSLDKGVRIIFTSAGSPSKFTSLIKERGGTVVHVVPNVRMAQKAKSAGVDAVVVEGSESGGLGGFEEVTTFVLIPQVVVALSIPVIASGGIGDGRGLAAALALGAEGVQMGTRFAVSAESILHENSKRAIIEACDTDTLRIYRSEGPARLLKNSFSERMRQANQRGADLEELKRIRGKNRTRQAAIEGDVVEGELGCGQVAGLLKKIDLVENIIRDTVCDYRRIVSNLP